MKIPLTLRVVLARSQIAHDARNLRAMGIPNEAVRRMIACTRLQWRVWVGAVV